MIATQKSPERAFALQKYLLLHSQHDALQKHISQITTTVEPTSASPTTSPSRSRFSSMSSSPESNDAIHLSAPTSSLPHHRRSGSMPRSHQRPQLRTRRSSLPTVIDESILGEIEEDENKLKDVNLQIKSTLTELLNCESVRNDNRYRSWIQTRLMDAEKELRGSRTRSCERRRSEDFNGGMMF